MSCTMAVIIGSHEVEKGTVQLKDLKRREQEEVQTRDLIERLDKHDMTYGQ